MLAIVDYGVGNLFSLKASLAAIGQEALVTGVAQELLRAQAVILPGVGAFADAAQKLRSTGLAQVVRQVAAAGVPLLGICLGMQLLFDKSLEFGEHEGLGLIRGTVRPLEGEIRAELKIPHIGWNQLKFPAPKHPLFDKVQAGESVYFVHSFHAAECEESVIATTDYGATITAAVARGNVMGCQFHPEKSGPVGLALLNSFCKEAGK